MKDYSEPAFPIAGACADNQFNGMTLRDYFAAKALQGAITGMMADGTRFAQGDEKTLAGVAYLLADAMLVERAQ